MVCFWTSNFFNSTFICWKYITKYAFTFKQKEFPGGKDEIIRQIKSLGKISYEEKVIAIIFGLTAFSWITRSFLLQKILPNLDDTIIAITFAVILFMIHSKKELIGKKDKTINWSVAVQMPWGPILLFAGGRN